MDRAYDVLIIGAGVIGCSAARELSRYCLSLCVLEKGPDICMETSNRNSAVLHAGYNNTPGSAMARFCVEETAALTGLQRNWIFPTGVPANW